MDTQACFRTLALPLLPCSHSCPYTTSCTYLGRLVQLVVLALLHACLELTHKGSALHLLIGEVLELRGRARQGKVHQRLGYGAEGDWQGQKQSVL